MTTYTYYVLRIHGRETWDEWGDDWLEHADVVGVPWLMPTGSGVSRESLRSRGDAIQLDWGVTLTS